MDQALLSKGNRSTVTELKPPYLTSIVNQFLCLNINIVGSGVAQLVERPLLIPEVRGSNPVIVKNLFIY